MVHDYCDYIGKDLTCSCFFSEFKICIIRIYNIGKFAIKNDRENMTLKKG